MTVLQFYNLAPAPGSCPFARRAWITLLEKKVPHETTLIDKANKGQAFLSLYEGIWPDPAARAAVPVIVDTDDTKVAESLVVVEYLAAKYSKQGTQLIPSDAAAAAKARLFQAVFDSGFRGALMGLMKADRGGLADAKAAWGKGLKVVDSYLTQHSSGSGPFLLDDYSLAEVNCAPFVSMAAILLPEFSEVDPVAFAGEQGLTRLQSWLKAVLSRPSTAETDPDHAEFIKGIETMMGLKRLTA